MKDQLTALAKPHSVFHKIPPEIVDQIYDLVFKNASHSRARSTIRSRLSMSTCGKNKFPALGVLERNMSFYNDTIAGGVFVVATSSR